MKINKRKPLHWIKLAAYFSQGCLGIFLRIIRFRPKDSRVVIFYGHKLNGNLLAIYEFLENHPQHGLTPVFLTMDNDYRRELQDAGIRVCNAVGFSCAVLLSGADALVSDHGLHSLGPLLGLYQRLKLCFFDVWHGIPFKGFDAEDFRLQHRYNEIWVASDLCRDELYLRRYGFTRDRVFTTGYARTDQLIKKEDDPRILRSSMGLPESGRLILFAPTWAQDSKGRSIYPFGYTEAEFLKALSGLARRHDATVILRSHLNSGNVGSVGLPPGVMSLPGSRYPDTESILLVSDVLVCDWSSIAFDYLLLTRPTFFLEVPPPFRKGFSLGPEYRFGPVVNDLKSLLHRLDMCLSMPDVYWRENHERHSAIIRKVYGESADGFAGERCVARLIACVEAAT